MARPVFRHAYTEDDYFALEASSAEKHEYVAGVILAMARARPRHNYLSTQVGALLRDRLRRGPCVALSADQRIGTPDGDYLYADGSVFCGEIVRGRRETAHNPVVLIEVLSPATQDYDRGEKLLRYKNIPSLRHVLLVDPDTLDVEHWFRGEAGWARHVYTRPDDVVRLDGLGVELPVAEIYEGVDRVPA